jgi:hypothetical protein
LVIAHKPTLNTQTTRFQMANCMMAQSTLSSR